MLQQIPTTPTARPQWTSNKTMTVNELLVLYAMRTILGDICSFTTVAVGTVGAMLQNNFCLYKLQPAVS